MPTATGALGHWRSLPFPLRAALVGIGGLLLASLARILGAWSIVLAVLLWACAGTGLLYASDRLRWIDRQGSVARVLSYYAPRPGYSASPPGGGRTSAPPPPPVVIKIPDISDFVGIEGVREDMERLLTSRALQGGTHATATMVALIGPRGTGKSDVALALAGRLQKAGVAKSKQILLISRETMPGLGDHYGPSAEALQAVVSQAAASLDGILLIDDLDWLASTPGGQTASEVGGRLVDVARGNPGRLFIVASGSSETLGRLDPARRWLSQLNLHRIEFRHLGRDALAEIFLRRLKGAKLTLDPQAERALDNKLKDLENEGGEGFQNAYAVDDLVRAVLSKIPRDRHVVIAQDIREANISI